MSKSTEHHAESKRAEQLRRRLADVALIRHQATELSDQWHGLVPDWAYTGQGAPDDLLPWNGPANKLSNLVDGLLETEAVVCTAILDLEAERTTADAIDWTSPDCDENRERLTVQMLSCIKQLGTDELAELVRVTGEHLDETDREAGQGGDLP